MDLAAREQDSSKPVSLKEFIEFAMKLQEPSSDKSEIRKKLRRSPQAMDAGKVSTAGSNPMLNHRRAQRKDRPYRSRPCTCSYPGCGRVLSNRQVLKRHMLQHTGELPFECGFPGCTHRCRYPANMKSHRELHLDPSARPRYYCNQPGCFKFYMQRSSLRGHLKSHRNHRPHVCHYPGCGLKFQQGFHLKEHSLVHLSKEDRPKYPCSHPGCSSVLLSASSLKKHCYKHTGDYPFFCEYPGCGRGFGTPSKYRKHMQGHMSKMVETSKVDLSRYPCIITDCNQSFAERSLLNCHMHTCHSEYLLVCDYPGCTKLYFNKQALSAHLRRHANKPSEYLHSRMRAKSPNSSATAPVVSKCSDVSNEFVLGLSLATPKPEVFE